MRIYNRYRVHLLHSKHIEFIHSLISTIFQNQVYNEIKLVFKNRADVTDVQEFDKLTLMERCISETLRLFPASPFNIRNNEEDITLKGLSYVQPKSFF